MSNTYSKGDIMDWDRDEYNYFMSLDDMTKVYYLHDYLYGELLEGEDIDEGPWDDVDEFKSEDDNKPNEFELPLSNPKKTTKIQVILDVDSLWITCPNHKLIEDTIKMFIMDGLILQLEESFEDTRHYRVIKHGSPISLN